MDPYLPIVKHAIRDYQSGHPINVLQRRAALLEAAATAPAEVRNANEAMVNLLLGLCLSVSNGSLVDIARHFHVAYRKFVTAELNGGELRRLGNLCRLNLALTLLLDDGLPEPGQLSTEMQLSVQREAAEHLHRAALSLARIGRASDARWQCIAYTVRAVAARALGEIGWARTAVELSEAAYREIPEPDAVVQKMHARNQWLLGAEPKRFVIMSGMFYLLDDITID